MWKSQQPVIVIFHNFPATGFKKLLHTIFKMAAQACRGGADSVIHSLGIWANILFMSGQGLTLSNAGLDFFQVSKCKLLLNFQKCILAIFGPVF